MRARILSLIIVFLFAFNSMASALGYAVVAAVKPWQRQAAPPRYYSWEDLFQEAKRQSSYMYFDNNSKPGYAMASLPRYPADSNSVGAALARFGVRSFNEGDLLRFPWTAIKPYLKKGDLAFIRSGGGIGSYVVRLVSSFTHVAMVYEPLTPRTLESQKASGVAIYDPERTWSNITTYSVKRVNCLSDGSIAAAVDNALVRYRNKPYFPSLLATSVPLERFFFKWADKNDMDSMYCSKLVYHAFINSGVNLDSGRTRSSYSGSNTSKDTDYAGRVPDGWSGVSPDDVYYSSRLGPDLYYAGLDKLGIPIAWWMF